MQGRRQSGRATCARLWPLLLVLCCTRPNPAYVVARGETPDETPGADAAAEPAISRDVGVRPADTNVEPPLPTPDSAAPPVDLAAPPDAAPPDAAPDVAPDMAPANSCVGDPAAVLCLRFEGQVADQSPNKLALTPQAVSFENGPDGLAATLTKQSRIEVRPSSALDVSAVTIEAWIKPRALPSSSVRMGIIDYTREYAFFVLPGGDLECTAVTSSGPITLAYKAAVRAGVWTAIGCVASGGRLGIWVGGHERASKSIGALKPSGTTDTLVVGGNYGSSNPDPFDGSIDNVRVWRAGRTGAELCAAAGSLCAAN
jgi:hypothetical protein